VAPRDASDLLLYTPAPTNADFTQEFERSCATPDLASRLLLHLDEIPEARSSLRNGITRATSGSPRTRRENVMNATSLKGMWNQIKGEAKIQWGRLTDDDLDQIEGNADKLMGKIQERYGYARDRAEREVNQFWSRYPSSI
jgi:uncharacterized protein YjbJ (UPF0337 family)